MVGWSGAHKKNILSKIDGIGDFETVRSLAAKVAAAVELLRDWHAVTVYLFPAALKESIRVNQIRSDIGPLILYRTREHCRRLYNLPAAA